jgi:hypothetical protein
MHHTYLCNTPVFAIQLALSAIQRTLLAMLRTSTCYTIGNGINSGFRINLPEEFVNCFPDFDRIQKMCEEYPGLKIAYEKFITTYKLVKNHYDTPEDERPRP